MRAILERWAWAISVVSLGLSWLVPNHYRPWTSFYGEVLVLPALICVVVIVFTRRPPSTLPRIACLLFALCGVPWIQWAAGQISYFGDPVLSCLYLIGGALCVWAGAGLPDETKDRSLFGLAILLVTVGVISSGISMYQWLGLDGLGVWVVDGEPGARAIGNVAQANHLATLLLCALMSVWFLLGRRKLAVGPAIVIAAPMFVAVALTQSRTAWVSVALVLGWTFTQRMTRFQEVPWRTPVVAAACSTFVVLYAVTLELPRQLLLATGASEARLDAGLRPLLWTQILEAVRQSPLVGYGWLQGHVAQGQAALVRQGLEYSSYSHNLLLDLLIWNGIPLGGLVAVMLVHAYVRLTLDANGQAQWFRWTMITVLGTHMMLEYPHAYAYFLMPFCFLVGQIGPKSRALNMRFPLLPVVGLLSVCAAALALLVVRDYLLIEEDGRLLRMELARVGFQRAQTPAPDVWVLDQMAATARVARKAAGPDMSAAELHDLKVLARRYPSRFFQPKLIIALALNHEADSARREMQRFRGLHGDVEYGRLMAQLRALADERYPELRTLLQLDTSG